MNYAEMHANLVAERAKLDALIAALEPFIVNDGRAGNGAGKHPAPKGRKGKGKSAKVIATLGPADPAKADKEKKFAQAKAMWAAGNKLSTIAAEVGIPYGTLYTRKEKERWPAPPSGKPAVVGAPKKVWV